MGRKNAPPSSGIAVRSPFCVALRWSSLAEKRREGPEQNPNHETNVEIQERGDQSGQVTRLAEALRFHFLPHQMV